MSVPMYYGGIDRTYGDVSIETADKVLDIIDNYIEIVESLEGDGNIQFKGEGEE